MDDQQSHQIGRTGDHEDRGVAADLFQDLADVLREHHAAQQAPQAHPVSDAGLPPNLAASFSAVNGALYAGGDPAQPQVGMLRVSYRVVPLGAATLEGVQRDGTLSAK